MSSTLILLLLAAWVLAVVLFASMHLIDRLLWVQVVLGVAGVFGAILPLAISPYTAFMMNAITLGIFIISLEMFKARPAGCRAVPRKARV